MGDRRVPRGIDEVGDFIVESREREGGRTWAHLDTEVGYGLPIGARFVGTPRVGLRTSEHGREYRVGYGIGVAERSKLDLELGIEAERRENPLFHSQEASGGTDQRVLGCATVQW